MVQRDVEERASIDHSHYSKLENDRIEMPEEATRKRIHRVFGTSDDDLVELGILVRMKPPIPGSSPYYTTPDRYQITIPKPVTIPVADEAADGDDETLQVSFHMAEELSPERKKQLKSFVRFLHEEDEAYRAQVRRDAERRRAEGIED